MIAGADDHHRPLELAHLRRETELRRPAVRLGGLRTDQVCSESMAAPRTEFGDGVWEVGVDIEPGIYVATDIKGGYWERMSGFDGDSTITNDAIGIAEQIMVEILPSDAAFKTTDCGTWRKRR